MAKEKKECCENGHFAGKNKNANASSGALYGMGFIGALIYFIQNADTFWIGLLGFFKALVWPAILIYKFLESFMM